MGRLFIPNKSMSNVGQPGYGTDMRTIEEWAAGITSGGGGTLTEITTDTPDIVFITNPTGPIVNIDVSGTTGGYLSLTGTGTGATPGTLTQSGPFNVINGQLTVTAGSTPGSGTVEAPFLIAEHLINSAFTGPMVISDDGNGGLNIETLNNTNGMTIGSSNGSPIFIGDTGSTTDTTAVTIGTYDGNIIVETTFGSGTITINSANNLQLNGSHIGFFGTSPHTRQSGTGITTVTQLVTALQNYGLLS